ncbi:hypothetical protein F2Q70_00014543 [Brassica cretica]|uniref:Uncharacterized protein n=1 Tax=Brassica cretica TaxID=69181 RepID=A0A3N6RKL8_BRACR|nr:hypothetical protein F2Q70_00014543 [Brassica cretica]
MSEQVEMLLPPLCLSGLSLVSSGNFTDLGCRRRLRLFRCERAPVMTSSIIVGEMKQMRNEWSVILYMLEHLANSNQSTFTMEPAFKYGMESQKRGGLRLCSDYYDQDGETRRLSDGCLGRRFEELERQRETCFRRWLKLRGINEFCGDADWVHQK